MCPDPSGVRFFKMSGGGNDFIAVVEPDFLTQDRIDALCARGLSVGADGAFSLAPVEEATAPSVRMDYFNADGSRAGLCVNGTRCAGLLAFHLGWAEDRVVILTDAGEIEADRRGEFEVALKLPVPSRPIEPVTVKIGGEEVSGWFIDTGVPHFVVEWTETLGMAPVVTLGEDLRQAPEFAPAGTNVDFVRFVASDQAEVRSYERGVESETLACGTGVLAAAAVGVYLGRAALPFKALTSGGFELEVAGEVDADRSIAEWTLAGDTRLVGEGVLSPGALVIPQPPLWSP